MPGKQKSESDKQKGPATDKPESVSSRGTGDHDSTPLDTDSGKPKKAGSWREIEARREKAALKASLADVWDEDFDLDDEILAEMDHKAEYFTAQTDAIEENFEEDGEGDDFYAEEETGD